jgi:hypothetical protein
MYMKVCHQGVDWKCLLDSGCECTIVPLEMVEGMSLRCTQQSLTAVNGTEIPVMGEVDLCLVVGDEEVSCTALVSRDIVEPMLGIDFLIQNECIWDFGQQSMKIRGQLVPLSLGNVAKVCRRMVVRSAVIKSAWSEMVANTRVKLRERERDGACDSRKEPGETQSELPIHMNHVPVGKVDVSESDVILEDVNECAELNPAEINHSESQDDRPLEMDLKHSFLLEHKGVVRGRTGLQRTRPRVKFKAHLIKSKCDVVRAVQVCDVCVRHFRGDPQCKRVSKGAEVEHMLTTRVGGDPVVVEGRTVSTCGEWAEGVHPNAETLFVGQPCRRCRMRISFYSGVELSSSVSYYG